MSDVVASMRARAAGRGLDALLPRLEAVAEPAVAVSVGKPVDDLPVGVSKLGGLPDLAEEWPTHEGNPLRFIGQVQLADLPRPAASALPPSGLLSFFIGDDEPASDVVHRVLYTSRNDLRRAGWPSSLEPGDAAALSFHPAISLPPAEKLVDVEAQWETVHALVQELLPSETRLLGHPEQIGSDPAVDAYLCRSGRKDILYSHHKTLAEIDREIANAWGDGDDVRAQRLEQERESIGWFRTDRPRHEAAIGRWRVLFQIGSHPRLDMMWWDSGLLTFLIDTDALAARDFTRTYAAIQTT